jgi:hypothetical protein
MKYGIMDYEVIGDGTPVLIIYMHKLIMLRGKSGSGIFSSDSMYTRSDNARWWCPFPFLFLLIGTPFLADR